MKQKYHLIGLASLLLLLLLVGTAVWAQTSGSFNLEWHVIGNGGQASSSASYQVNGTIGQSMASQPEADGRGFAVSSGYWFGDARTTIYLPAMRNN